MKSANAGGAAACCLSAENRALPVIGSALFFG